MMEGAIRHEGYINSRERAWEHVSHARAVEASGNIGFGYCVLTQAIADRFNNGETLVESVPWVPLQPW